MSSATLEQLIQRVLKHRDERDWGQFHTPKELAVSLCVEATEFLSLFQWKNEQEVGEILASKREHVSDELADVLHSLLLLASDLKVDLGEALHQKLAKDALKYPVEKARGKNKKYTELS